MLNKNNYNYINLSFFKNSISFIFTIFQCYIVKIFLKKDSFAERRAMVYYSNYRVADCKVFFYSPTWRVAERNRAILIGIGLTEKVGLLMLLRWWMGRVNVSFLEV